MKPYVILGLIVFFIFSCQIIEEKHNHSLFWGFAVEGFPITEERLLLLEQETGVPPAMIVFYLQWPEPGHKNESIIPSLEAIWKRGAVPCITWEPMSVVDQTARTIPYQEILEGKYDVYLSDVIEEVLSWGKPLVIRFAHEMNLSRYHWGTSLKDFGPQSTVIYKKMFVYVVGKFKNKNVKNVFWAFCPNADSIPSQSWNSPGSYYPGDPFVDILGMDGYNWDINTELSKKRNLGWTSPWRSFEQIFSPLYQELKQISPRKPIIVFETASTERPGSLKKSLWIKDAIKTSNKWNVEGIVWFQVNKEEDWSVSHQDLYKPPQSSFQSWLTSYPNDFK